VSAKVRLAFVVVVLAAIVAPGAARPAAQGWHPAGLAAFDAVWRTINDTYFDPAFGGLDWAAVRTELRPRAERATSADEQRAAIREMLARLGQSHFTLLTATREIDAPRGTGSVPVDLRVTPDGVLVTRRHAGAEVPIQPGDTVLRIDGQEVTDLLAGIDPDDPRRFELSWRRVMRAMSGAVSTRVVLTVQQPGAGPRDVEVMRVEGPGEDVTVGNLPPLRAHLETAERTTPSGRSVGIIRFNIWMAAIAQPFELALDRFRRADGLVIDLRGNPGGLADMIRGIAGHLLDEPAVLGRMRMRGLDLEFRVNPRRSTTDGRSVRPYGGPVAILVDGLTASASECFAGGLQALGRARVFGVRTAGQALPAATQQLVSGDVLLYAVGDFVTSTGQRLEGAGVAPDVEVPLTPEALAAGRDAEAAAIDWIDRGASAR
jgi:carboxyl-terminal processing protease